MMSLTQSATLIFLMVIFHYSICVNGSKQCKGSNCDKECPKNVAQVACSHDPCLKAYCLDNTKAVCKANYCGGCNAEWFLYDKKIECKNKACSEICPLLWQPKCGSDGKTYDSMCLLQIAQCQGNTVTMQYDGVCRPPTKCERLLQKNAPPGAFVPECMPDGAFKGKQCHGSTGYCWCVHWLTGEEISGTRQIVRTVDNVKCNPPCEKICNLDYEPVCGSDGKTYINKCVLENEQCGDKKLRLKRKGECEKKNRDTTLYASTNVTEPKCPKSCSKIYQPQCGTDDVTYVNLCQFKEQQKCKNNALQLAYSGKCKECPANIPSTMCTFQPCAQISCLTERDAVCKPNYCGKCKEEWYLKGKQIKCEKTKCREACPYTWDPMCASDGVTYSNDCALKVAQCKDNSIYLQYKGSCKKDNDDKKERFVPRQISVGGKVTLPRSTPKSFPAGSCFRVSVAEEILCDETSEVCQPKQFGSYKVNIKDAKLNRDNTIDYFLAFTVPSTDYSYRLIVDATINVGWCKSDDDESIRSGDYITTTSYTFDVIKKTRDYKLDMDIERYTSQPSPRKSKVPVKKCTEKVSAASNGKRLVGAFTPQCDEDTGDYKNKQCHGSTGYCWCVNTETGVEIEGTRKRGNLECGCTHKGKYYNVGESTYEECNKCVCSKAGGMLCTLVGCLSGVCYRDGKEMQNGDSYYDGCNTCTCNVIGEERVGAISCTEMACISNKEIIITGRIRFSPAISSVESNSCLRVKAQEDIQCDQPLGAEGEMPCNIPVLGSSKIINPKLNADGSMNYEIKFSTNRTPYSLVVDATLNIGWCKTGEDWLRNGDFFTNTAYNVKIEKKSNYKLDLDTERYGRPSPKTKDSTESECPPDIPVVACTLEPCAQISCVDQPDAVCKPNFCGVCNAQWFLKGKLVKCEKTKCREACPYTWDPMCGSDGVTYANDCALKVAQCKDNSIYLKIKGSCKKAAELTIKGRIQFSPHISSVKSNSCLRVTAKPNRKCGWRVPCKIPVLGSIEIMNPKLNADGSMDYEMKVSVKKRPYAMNVDATLNVGWCKTGEDWLRIGDYLTTTAHNVRTKREKNTYKLDIETERYDRSSPTTKDSTKSECPPDIPVVACTLEPCAQLSCVDQPNAVCKANFCGVCNAQWFLKGKLVKCEKTKCREACPYTWDPMCGSDGVTYANDCALKVAQCKDNSIYLKIKGSCKTDASCVKPCTRIYKPVCGTNGITYSNKCEFKNVQCKDKSLKIKNHFTCKDDVKSLNCPKHTSVRTCIISPCKTDTCPAYPNARCVENFCKPCTADFYVANKKVDCTLSAKPKPRAKVQGIQAVTSLNIKTPECLIVCPKKYAPVCGSDGKTYSNECMMTSQECVLSMAIFKVHDGNCGHCKRACPRINAPTCGSDGNTYGNECEMTKKICQTRGKVMKAYTGKCGSPKCDDKCDGQPTNKPACGSDGETYSSMCQLQKKSCQTSGRVTFLHHGKCKKCSKACSRLYDPYCGTDGKTHSNLCILNYNTCKSGGRIQLKHRYKCGARQCPEVCPKARNNVCGTDKRTYANLCKLQQAACKSKKDISLYHIGSCASRCDRFRRCPAVYRPVCGTDQKTYSNRCELRAANCKSNGVIRGASKGRCRSCPVPLTNCALDPCQHATCPKFPGAKCVSNFCRGCNAHFYYRGKRVNDCGTKCNPVCTKEYFPVCGTDGKTYGNECQMNYKSCETSGRVELAYIGQCKTSYY